jgi:hypothetical protein
LRTLLIIALAATLVDCSHQSQPSQATDSCASRNPLACWMSVRVSIERAPLTTNSAVESKLAITRKTREIAVLSRTAQKHQPADAENVGKKSRHSSLMANVSHFMSTCPDDRGRVYRRLSAGSQLNAGRHCRATKSPNDSMMPIGAGRGHQGRS